MVHINLKLLLIYFLLATSFTFLSSHDFLLISSSSQNLNPLCLDTGEVSRPDSPVLARVLGRDIPPIPCRLRNGVLPQELSQCGKSVAIGVLKFGAVWHDSRHDGHGKLFGCPGVAALDGTGILVAWHANANRDVCAETEALLAELAFWC